MNKVPSKIELHQKSGRLELSYPSGEGFMLNAEFLRVHSPSAEVRGHGGAGGQLPLNKEQVSITQVEVVGNYALKISFSDQHDSGLYTWDYLLDLARNKEQYWDEYKKKAAALTTAATLQKK